VLWVLVGTWERARTVGIRGGAGTRGMRIARRRCLGRFGDPFLARGNVCDEECECEFYRKEIYFLPR
jgi:hypothetical protein